MTNLEFVFLLQRLRRRIRRLITDWSECRRDLKKPTILSNLQFQKVINTTRNSSIPDPYNPQLMLGLTNLIDLDYLSNFVKNIVNARSRKGGRIFNVSSEDIHKHTFEFLGSGAINTNYDSEPRGFRGVKFSINATLKEEETQRRLMLEYLDETSCFIQDDHPSTSQLRDLISGSGPTYRPIDWHRDWKSGYRWDPETWYKHIKFGHVYGADIKMPWELSRCQHLVQLGVHGLVSDDSEANYQEISLQIIDWVCSNKPRYGVNWRTSMEVAIRATNLIWAWALIPEKARSPTVQWMLSKTLYQHALHIESNLDYYPGRTNNHYLADIVGLLYIAFACPEFPESSRWIAFSLQELVSEMENTVYSDGVNHEASTSYHCLVTELFLHGAFLASKLTPTDRECIRVCQTENHHVSPPLAPSNDWQFVLDKPKMMPDWFLDRLWKMVGYVYELTKPNGLIPQWGDMDNSRYLVSPRIITDAEFGLDLAEHPCNRQSLLAAGAAFFENSDWVDSHQNQYLFPALFKEKSRFEKDNNDKRPHCLIEGPTNHNALENSICKIKMTSEDMTTTSYPLGGTCVMRNEHIWLGVRFNNVGRNGLGGHGHNDSLSIELNIAGLDFIVDWGTGVYTSDPELRNKFRGTFNHSTVTAEGLEQNPIRSNSKHLFVLNERSYPEIIELGHGRFSARHSGFGPSHTRRITLDRMTISMEDDLRIDRASTVVLTLSPEVEPFLDTEGTRLILERGNVILTVTPKPSTRNIRIISGCYSESYGTFAHSNKIIIERNTHRDALLLSAALLDASETIS